MKPIEYFWKSTLIAFFVPAFIVTSPLLLLACITPAIVLVLPVLVAFYLVAQWAWKQGIRFVESAEDGVTPMNFLIFYLPFFLPVLYTLVFAVIELKCYSTTFFEREQLLIAFVAFPHLFVIWFGFLLAMGDGLRGGFLFPFLLWTYSIAAVVFSCIVWYISPVPTKNKVAGITIITALLAVFSGLAIIQYKSTVPIQHETRME